MHSSLYFQPWYDFQHPMVRQLAFVIASPNILCQLPTDLNIKHAFQLHNDAFWQHQYNLYLTRLKQLDECPQPLLDFLAPLKSTRLGLRFEYLMWFWLSEHHYHGYRVIQHSAQQIQGKHTLGELDFLIENEHENCIEHWEVALKYYLGQAKLATHEWVGLNRSDTLARKLQHFTNKQFQFEQVGEYQIERKYAVLKGQLYLPNSAHTPPHWMNSARQSGTWLSTLPHLSQHSNFRRLDRQEWICPSHFNEAAKVHWWTNGLYLNYANPLDIQYLMLQLNLYQPFCYQ